MGQVPMVQELTGRSHKELLADGRPCFVYLRKGPITQHENKMLLNLEERFRPQLEDHGLKLAWAWMDVRVEKKLGRTLDAEVLPSAVILRSGERPGFAPMKHDERDGEGCLLARLPSCSWS